MPVPAMAAGYTLDKAIIIKTGSRSDLYLAYLVALSMRRQEVTVGQS